MIKWIDILNSSKYQRLSPEERVKVKLYFWDNYVKPLYENPPEGIPADYFKTRIRLSFVKNVLKDSDWRKYPKDLRDELTEKFSPEDILSSDSFNRALKFPIFKRDWETAYNVVKERYPHLPDEAIFNWVTKEIPGIPRFTAPKTFETPLAKRMKEYKEFEEAERYRKMPEILKRISAGLRVSPLGIAGVRPYTTALDIAFAKHPIAGTLGGILLSIPMYAGAGAWGQKLFGLGWGRPLGWAALGGMREAKELLTKEPKMPWYKKAGLVGARAGAEFVTGKLFQVAAVPVIKRFTNLGRGFKLIGRFRNLSPKWVKPVDYLTSDYFLTWYQPQRFIYRQLLRGGYAGLLGGVENYLNQKLRKAKVNPWEVTWNALFSGTTIGVLGALQDAQVAKEAVINSARRLTGQKITSFEEAVETLKNIGVAPAEVDPIVRYNLHQAKSAVVKANVGTLAERIAKEYGISSALAKKIANEVAFARDWRVAEVALDKMMAKAPEPMAEKARIIRDLVRRRIIHPVDVLLNPNARLFEPTSRIEQRIERINPQSEEWKIYDRIAIVRPEVRKILNNRVTKLEASKVYNDLVKTYPEIFAGGKTLWRGMKIKREAIEEDPSLAFSLRDRILETIQNSVGLKVTVPEVMDPDGFVRGSSGEHIVILKKEEKDPFVEDLKRLRPDATVEEVSPLEEETYSPAELIELLGEEARSEAQIVTPEEEAEFDLEDEYSKEEYVMIYDYLKNKLSEKTIKEWFPDEYKTHRNFFNQLIKKEGGGFSLDEVAQELSSMLGREVDDEWLRQTILDLANNPELRSYDKPRIKRAELISRYGADAMTPFGRLDELSNRDIARVYKNPEKYIYKKKKEVEEEVGIEGLESIIEKAKKAKNFKKFYSSLDYSEIEKLSGINIRKFYKQIREKPIPLVSEEEEIENLKQQVIERGFDEKQVNRATKETLERIIRDDLKPEEVSILQSGDLKVLDAPYMESKALDELEDEVKEIKDEVDRADFKIKIEASKEEMPKESYEQLRFLADNIETKEKKISQKDLLAKYGFTDDFLAKTDLETILKSDVPEEVKKAAKIRKKKIFREQLEKGEVEVNRPMAEVFSSKGVELERVVEYLRKEAEIKLKEASSIGQKVSYDEVEEAVNKGLIEAYTLLEFSYEPERYKGVDKTKGFINYLSNNIERIFWDTPLNKRTLYVKQQALIQNDFDIAKAQQALQEGIEVVTKKGTRFVKMKVSQENLEEVKNEMMLKGSLSMELPLDEEGHTLRDIYSKQKKEAEMVREAEEGTAGERSQGWKAILEGLKALKYYFTDEDIKILTEFFNGIRSKIPSSLQEKLDKLPRLVETVTDPVEKAQINQLLGPLIEGIKKQMVGDKEIELFAALGIPIPKLNSLRWKKIYHEIADRLPDKEAGKYFLDSLVLPYMRALDWPEFREVFYAIHKIGKRESSALRWEAYARLGYFEWKRELNRKGLEKLADFIYTSTEEEKPIPESELNENPTIGLSYRSIKDVIKFAQSLIAEAFKWKYYYYQPENISATLLRKALDNVKDKDPKFASALESIKGLRKMEKVEEVLPEWFELYKEALDMKIRDDLNRIKEYFPIMWNKNGPYVLYAEKGKGKKKEAVRYTGLKYELEEIAEKLKEEGYKIIFLDKVRKALTEPWARELTAFEFETLLRAANVKMTPEIQKIRDYIYSKGFSKHLYLKRKGVKGYPRTYENMEQSLIYFLENAIGMYARQKAYRIAQDKVREIANKRRRQYAQSFLDNWYNAPRQAVDALRTAVSTWYLGLKASFLFLNAHQVPIVTLPLLVKEGASFPEATRYIAQAMKITTKYMTVKSYRKLEGKVRRGEANELEQFLWRWKVEDVIGGQLLDQLLIEGYKLNKIISLLNIGIVKTEEWNRTVSAIAGYFLGKEKGLSGEELYQYAAYISDTSQDIFGLHNLPLIIGRRRGLARVLSLMAFQFKHFIWMYLSLLLRWAKNPKALLTALLALFTISGLKGMPFFNFFEKILKKTFRIDIQDTIYSKFPKSISRAFYYGLESAALNANVSTLVGFGDVIPAESLEIEDLLGAGFGIPHNMIVAFALASKYQDWWKLFRGMPTAAALVGRALEWYSKGGVRTAKGRLVAKVTPWQMVKAGLGFYPLGVTERWVVDRKIKELDSLKRDKKRSIHSLLAQARYYGRPELEKKAYELLRQWNKRFPEAKIYAINPFAVKLHFLDLLGRMRLPKTLRVEYRRLLGIYGLDELP